MTGFDSCRREALRELDGFVDAVEGLAGEDWEREAPCVDWKVRDVVEHVIDVVGYSWYAMFLRYARTGSPAGYRVPYTDMGVGQRVPQGPTPRSPEELVEQLSVSAAELRGELEQFSVDDLVRLEKGSQRGVQVIKEFVCEFGIHRADLELGVGHVDFVFRPEVVAAVGGLHKPPGEARPPNKARPAPEDNVSYLLAGDTFTREFSFTLGEPAQPDQPTQNGNWTVGLSHDKCCSIVGSDTAICLVLAGRISTHDERVRSTPGFPPRFF